MNLELLKQKKILILGLGREGKSSFRFLRRHFPKKTLGLADKKDFQELPENLKKIIKKDKNLKLYLGKNYLRSVKDYQIIFKTPGIQKEFLPKLKSGQKITSQTEIFLKKFRNQTIGITGTKGKGTTAGLIYKIIKDNSFQAKLIGNMGRPALDYYDKAKKDDIFVFEISSHQLRDLKISPHIAVFLNIYPDHLDYFKNFKEYFQAKANIAKWQSQNDYFIYNKRFLDLKDLAKKTKAKTIAFRAKNFAENIEAAKAVAGLFKITKTEKSIKDFKNIEHRLELIGKFKGIKFYNDSASTIPQSTIAALDFLKNVDTLILGGSKKGSDFDDLAKKILEKEIKTLIFLPIEGKRIWQEIKKIKSKNLAQHFFVNNLKEAINLCFQHTAKGKICLLSPACASFSGFKNYQDRGEQFKKILKELAKK